MRRRIELIYRPYLFRMVIGVLFCVLCIGTGMNNALAQGPPPAKVRVASIVQEEIAPQQELLGTFAFDRVSEVSSEVAGLVEQVMVAEGQTVAAGDVLLKLDTELLYQEIRHTRIRMKQLTLRIDHARKEMGRIKRLFDQSVTSEQAYDQALVNVLDLEQERAGVDAVLQKLLIQQGRSVIKAPFAGVVLSRDAEAGSWVQPGKTLCRLGASRDFLLRVPVAETMLSLIEMGSQVQIMIPAFDREVTGTLMGVASMADLRTKQVTLKIKADVPAGVLENMSAMVHVPAGPEQLLSIVPRAALIKFQGGDFVYTIEEHKAVIIPVQVLAWLGDRLGVQSPLQPGQFVVVEGNERLRPDQSVVVGD